MRMGCHAWILKLIHCVLALARCIWRARSKLSSSAASWTGGKALLMQQLAGAQLKKPSHLGVVILEERVSYSDLANIVVWSRAYGIACVSVYNPAGSANLDASRLNAAVSQAAAKAGSWKDTRYHYSIRAVDYCSEKASLAAVHDDRQEAAAADDRSRDGVGTPVKHLTTDECSVGAAAAMQVLLLPRLDGGHGLLVAAARARGRAMALARRRRLALSDGGGVGSAAVDGGGCTPESLLEDELTSRLPVTCPEAVLQFGSVTSLCGYLPWHVRLTEIFTLLSHVNVGQREFLHVMQLYGGTEQRLGT